MVYHRIYFKRARFCTNTSLATIEAGKSIKTKTIKEENTEAKYTNPRKIHNPNWRIMVDDYTDLKFSDFYSTKDDMVEPTCEKISL